MIGQAPTRTHPTYGFTMLEVVLSLVILSIVLLAAQSAIMVAAKAVPNSQSASESVASAAGVMDQITADLQYAKTFSDMTANRIVFIVPDRTGDGQPETIRYEWSGLAGGALMRQMNGNTPVAIAPAVHFFELHYDKNATTTNAGTAEGPEVVLSSYDTTNSLNDAAVTESNWRAQHFNPILPADTVSWRVTRVFIKARIRGSNIGETRVQIRPAVSNKPSNVILGETILYENTLTGSFTWKEIPIVQQVQLNPNYTACFVLEWKSDSESCDIQYRGSLLFGEPVYCLLSGHDNSWNPSNDVILHYVYGRITTADPTQTTYNLAAVRCAIQLPSSTSPPLTTTIRTVEQPQVPGP
jgi:prepilin-type N-terminal cleavage/methylation domain-containing protein